MKVAYLCHPISGDVKATVDKILRIVKHINLNYPDVVPFVPYLADVLAMDDDDPVQRERGLKNNTEIFCREIIHELWICSDTASKGMIEEIRQSLIFNIKIEFKYEEFKNL